MSERGRITAVLLSYNHAHTIGRAIDAILAQTQDFAELIVSDDCSTDDTLEVVKPFQQRSPKVRVVQPERNLGMAGNANFAVAQATTEYVALLHHDDVCVPEAFQSWKAVLDEFPDVAYAYNAHYDEQGRSSVIDPHDSPRVDGRRFLDEYLLPRWACPVWGAAFIRKSAWDAVGGMKLKYGSIADVYLWMELASRYAVGYVPLPLFRILHDRPADYPEEYVAFSWKRHRALVDIHGDIRTMLIERGMLSRTSLAVYRCRASLLTLKWIAYAAVRRKTSMLRTLSEGRSEYELPGVELLRGAVMKLGGVNAV